MRRILSLLLPLGAWALTACTTAPLTSDGILHVSAERNNASYRIRPAR